MHTLDGKTAIITGASRGLGRQLALDFARAGAAGLTLVARSAAPLAELRRQLHDTAPGVGVVTITADLAQPNDIERAAATALAAFGGKLDILVNNASILGPTPMPFLLDYPPTDFRAVLDINLVAPFLLIQKVLPALVERGGSIINVTSDAGVVGYPGWGAYGISKSAIEGLSRTWAAELAGTGVRVNWVDPGAMDTAMHRAAEPDEDPRQWADPAAVTGVFLYLASDASRGVSGQRFLAQEPGWGQNVEPVAAEGSRP